MKSHRDHFGRKEMFESPALDNISARIDALIATRGAEYPPGTPERNALERLTDLLQKQRDMAAKMETVFLQNPTAFMTELKKVHADMLVAFSDCADVLRKAGIEPDAELFQKVQNTRIPD
jgi:predicted alpha/beta-hydrolase family hydrolase